MAGVDTARDDGRHGSEAPRDEYNPAPGAVDWLLGILTGVIGLALGVTTLPADGPPHTSSSVNASNTRTA